MPDSKKVVQEQKVRGCGYYIHYAPPEGSDDCVNYHTHGLMSSRNHKDFQVILPADAEVIHSTTAYEPTVAMPSNLTIICSIIWSLVAKIDDGEVFEAGMEFYEPIHNYKIKLVDSIENGREVLRILLPDEDGRCE